MILAHDVENASGSRLVVFLHGILGSRNNWKSFTRRLRERIPDLATAVVDLRNHGESHGFPPPHTVQTAANDVVFLCRHLQRTPDVIVGHSYGGKVALLAALDDLKPREVWSLDSPPGLRTFGDGGEIDRVLSAVRAVPMPVTSRKDVAAFLRAQGLSESLCLWMTTNLRAVSPDDDRLTWKINLSAIDEMLASFGALDLWPRLLDRHRNDSRVVLVRGGRSTRFTDAESHQLTRAVATGAVTDHVLQNAGHWLHTDDPDGLLALLAGSFA
jgi:esterase